MSVRRTLLFLLFALALTGCAEIAQPTPRPVTRLTLISDDSTEWLAQKFVDAYAQQRPDITITLQLANSTTAIRSAQEISYTVGLAARAIKSNELISARAVPLARDGIAVIVNRNNPINAIMRTQVTDIFTGQIGTWPLGPDVGKPIAVVSREDGSGTRDAFDALVMNGQRVTRAGIIMPTETAMINYISQHTNAIGYASMANLTPDVRALIVDDVALTPQNIEGKKYSLVRTLSLIVPLSPNPTMNDFVAFAIGNDGQKILAQRLARITP
jgi:phosphate transport system substrate-binding protein